MSSAPPTVKELMSKDTKEIEEFLGGIYEHSPWVAQELLVSSSSSSSSSISTVTELATAMKAIVDKSPMEQKLKLLRVHPDLCAKVDQLKEMTAESQQEQGKSGLQTLTDQEYQDFSSWNTEYFEKHGFPFILAVRNATKHTVLAALKGRKSHPNEMEVVIALQQVHKIAWMRLLAKLNPSDATGFLTCHVLDTANGCPAADMRIELHRLSPPESAGLVAEYITNDDGRLSNGPALKGGKEFLVGEYEWTFYVADYFASKGTFTTGTPFLNTIPLRFGIDNPDEHYHVPLLVSPWSFSTYRGS